MPSSVDTSIKILIIEDQEEWAKIIREILPGNFHLDHASTLAKAESYLRSNVYDVIVTDLVLSDENTIQNILQDFQNLIFVLKQLSSTYKLWPPIIVTTIHDVSPQIPELLNDYGGWIWGWHEKDRFDHGRFHNNIEIAVNTRREFEEALMSKSSTLPEKWMPKDILSHLTFQSWGAIGSIVGFLMALAYYVGYISSY